jgi:hypothetical protein
MPALGLGRDGLGQPIVGLRGNNAPVPTIARILRRCQNRHCENATRLVQRTVSKCAFVRFCALGCGALKQVHHTGPHVTKISYMNKETETNFGWWTDKPERPLRACGNAGPRALAVREGGSVWLRSAVVIALVLTFAWALARLAGS